MNTRVKLALLLGFLALVIIAILLSGFLNGGEGNPLTQAVTGGELALTAVGRGHESLADFAKNQKEMARDLLKATEEAQDHAESRLTYASKTDDIFVLNMVNNYGLLLNSSRIMSKGADRLLAVSDTLEKALDYYHQETYAEAAGKASICLESLAPVADEFKAWNRSLDTINYRYLASGHRDRVKFAVTEYRSGMEVYLDYISLLEAIKEGANYSEIMSEIRDLFNQLQHELALNNTTRAQELVQQISDKLQPLKQLQYQRAASSASQVDPSMLEGMASNVAQNLKSQIKDLSGIQGLEKYLENVQKYIQAQALASQGDSQGAQNAIDQGLSAAGQGKGEAPADLKDFYTALQVAFNSLRMQIRGGPDQG